MIRQYLALLHIPHMHIDLALNVAYISCTYMEHSPRRTEDIKGHNWSSEDTLFALPANSPPHLEHDIASHSSKSSTAYNAVQSLARKKRYKTPNEQKCNPGTDPIGCCRCYAVCRNRMHTWFHPGGSRIFWPKYSWD